MNNLFIYKILLILNQLLYKFHNTFNHDLLIQFLLVYLEIYQHNLLIKILIFLSFNILMVII